MDTQDIQSIELEYLQLSDYQALKTAMISAYPSMPDAYWKEAHIAALIQRFPEGQVVLKINGALAGCALSIRVNESVANKPHSYEDITGQYTFSTHEDQGDLLYGIDVFIKPEYRGLRLGRRLYDYRKELCEKLNLKGIVFGGRIPRYHAHSESMSPKAYIEAVKRKELHDPVLSFQIANDFQPVRALKNYLSMDENSQGMAVLLRWNNIYFEEVNESATTTKRIVRVGLVQWQMRPYEDLEHLMKQVEFFVDAVSGYRSDFALFPEFFNAPLMAKNNHMSEAEAIRSLAEHTQDILVKFQELAISYNINLITGSMPEIRDGQLYNVGYLCRRDGSYERYEKLHVTPDEAKVWGMQGGQKLEVFTTDCGKIGVLVCYDVEFPELSRLLADQGMDILFVPFLTDTQNGYSRVRHCAQARAIENECYVAIAGSVGNLPNVENMDIQYAQSMVFTPCDFAFPSNGIKAEATTNTEMILIADVDLDLLRELHTMGSVRNLNDRRTDLFSLSKKV